MGIKWISAISLFGVLVGCDPEEQTKQVFQAPEEFKLGLGAVYERYLIVLSGLTTGNLTIAKNSLSAMHGKLHEVPIEGLDSSAMIYWDTGNIAIMQILHHPSLMNGGLPEVRKAVMDFSPLLLDRIERYGIRPLSPIYLFHGPRAGEPGDAVWLQKDGTLRNPYTDDSLRIYGNMVREVSNLP